MALNQEQDQVITIPMNALIEDLVLEFKTGTSDILWYFEWTEIFSIVALETELQTIVHVLLEFDTMDIDVWKSNLMKCLIMRFRLSKIKIIKRKEKSSLKKKLKRMKLKMIKGVNAL
ncbi:MAG: hypothetical protein COW84_06605 [Gammaproteobacteria bacterium CG22_combo_CG10-13_8_21_14_all_40_8]|nr:MAG: hypothetical protein COW84_06605 [Gammaproteobacteria bacterium CG22_combo_CG10-13_8_21_14_all_40_8]